MLGSQIRSLTGANSISLLTLLQVSTTILLAKRLQPARLRRSPSEMIAHLTGHIVVDGKGLELANKPFDAISLRLLGSADRSPLAWQDPGPK